MNDCLKDKKLLSFELVVYEYTYICPERSMLRPFNILSIYKFCFTIVMKICKIVQAKRRKFNVYVDVHNRGRGG